MKTRSRDASPSIRASAYSLCALGLALDGWRLFAGPTWEPLRPPSLAGWLFLAGGPITILLAGAISVRASRLAGALLLVGGSLAAMALSLEAGPRLGHYFLGMVLHVLPQVSAGGLFLALARGVRPDRKGR